LLPTGREVGGLEAFMVCGPDWFLTVSIFAVGVLVRDAAGHGRGEL